MMNATEIVIVEDNQYDSELIVRCFRQNSLADNLIILEDGEKALDFIFCRGKYYKRNVMDLPSVIFLDLKLPLVHGLEVLRQIKSNQKTRKIPVIIVTSSREEADIKEAYKLGANSYIVKPVNFDEFNKRIKLVGMYWIKANERPV